MGERVREGVVHVVHVHCACKIPIHIRICYVHVACVCVCARVCVWACVSYPYSLSQPIHIDNI